MSSKLRAASMNGTVKFDVGPTRGQRYRRLPFDPTPPDTTISNLYTIDHQSLNVNSSDCWRERVKAELGNKKLETDSKLRSLQKNGDKRRMSAALAPRRTIDMTPIHRDKPLVPYRENSLRSIPARKFSGERNFKKIPNYRNQSHFTFCGMDGHSFVDNTRLRYSTLHGLSHDNAAVTKFVTENPCIIAERVTQMHDKLFK
eukprot:TRINITY_DN387_c0_g1_i2.p1 TRINITY_DN387_c0_g1~~TRINITY_DN387_c0_g1_i2.p1  ORF type:complete len:201 (+),score=20.72 TRINITY_DN387_c0_g1_i2:212-814(+)